MSTSRRPAKPTIAHMWRNWPYKNTTLLIVGLVLLFYLVQTPFVDSLIDRLGTFGYVGAFVTGIFFVSTFTAAPAALVMFSLAERLNPAEVALLAGLGAMLGDYLVFRLVRDQLFDELQPLFNKLQHPYLRTLFKTPYFAWFLPVLGAVIIASPLPDEAGVSLLGLSKIKKWQFFVVTFALNVVGIFIIVSIASMQ